MGFLSRLVGGQGEHERQVEELYTQMYCHGRGMPLDEARKVVRDFIRQAKAESEADGSGTLPPNFGDTLLSREATDEKIKASLAVKRQDGVRDDDIRWWWNMPDLDRRIMIKDDDFERMGVALHHVEAGLSMAEAAVRIRAFHPMYGDPRDVTNTSGDDRPLPYELKDRVNIYIQKRTQADQDAFKRDFSASSTFNAHVRAAIREGTL